MAPGPPLIAIVDDDSSVRDALGSLVRALGYRVQLFGSAEQFLAAPLAAPDCMVCDLNLPGMSGWDLLARLRATRRFLPVILITAFADESPGASGVRIFHKPFDAAQLGEAIRNAVGDRL
ncbi:response regulator transcription factor [Oceaniglobus roseus]|uniref:response regulator transcription factor n=1 Tax=Oceaniglobus roseus TaxID=1737570 RepID=UPI000C7F76CB|nr:response regulator [Kandeliimicrobium roseum]